jgi:hypothetical protein
MIYIFRSVASEGAKALAAELGGRKVKRFPTIGANDKVICWGEQARGVGILNGAPIQNKFADALTLKAKGVPTVEVSRTKPKEQEVNPTTTILAHRDADRTAVAQYIEQLQTWLKNNPVVTAATWLGRRSNHVGGHDLLTPPATPDFWSRKEDIVEEYRIHCFKGRSIRAGKKIVREGLTNTGAPYVAHPWIRSLDGGWRICYDDFKSRKEMRDLAARAVEALSLDFGAVDLGKKRDGSLIVLEVNRAPGLEGGTITAYANAIKGWMGGA